MPKATEHLVEAEVRQRIGQLWDLFEQRRARTMSTLADRVDWTDSRLKEVEEALLSETVAGVNRRWDCEQMLAKAVELHNDFKKELMQELQILRNEMQAHRGSPDALSLERRLQATEQMLSELHQAHQNHGIEANALRQQLEVAVRKCEEQLSRADTSFSALLQENLAACVEAVEQIFETKLPMHNISAALESSKLEVVGQQCQCTKRSEDIESDWRELQQQCEALAQQSETLAHKADAILARIVAQQSDTLDHKADAILAGSGRLPSAPSSCEALAQQSEALAQEADAIVAGIVAQQSDTHAHQADAILVGSGRLPSAPSSYAGTISEPGSMPRESSDDTVKSECRIFDAETGLWADLKTVEAASLWLESPCCEALNLSPRDTVWEMPVVEARQIKAPVGPSTPCAELWQLQHSWQEQQQRLQQLLQ